MKTHPQAGARRRVRVAAHILPLAFAVLLGIFDAAQTVQRNFPMQTHLLGSSVWAEKPQPAGGNDATRGRDCASFCAGLTRARSRNSVMTCS